jgi:hypothetical protein
VTAWPDRRAVFVREVPGHHSEPRHRAVQAQRRALAAVLGSGEPGPHVRTFVENARPTDALAADALSAPGSGRANCQVVVVDDPRDA